jgi:hypothetical protein
LAPLIIDEQKRQYYLLYTNTELQCLAKVLFARGQAACVIVPFVVSD